MLEKPRSWMILHALQGKPPRSETGREGAVGQIHFICTLAYLFIRNHSMRVQWYRKLLPNVCVYMDPYVWKRHALQELRQAAERTETKWEIVQKIWTFVWYLIAHLGITFISMMILLLFMIWLMKWALIISTSTRACERK